MISADVGAVEHGASEGVQIAANELDATFMGDAAVLGRAIEIGAAVLSDFERSGFVFARNAEDEIVEPIGPDFPGEIGERAFVGIEIVDSGGVFARAGRNGGDKLPTIIVDTEKIERSAAELQVAGLDAHELERIVAGECFGIFAAKGGMDEPNVAESMGAVGGLAIGVALGGGLAVGHVESGADL